MLQPKASQIEHTPSFNKLTDETNKLAAQPQQQQTTSSLLKPNDNNNNHINGNKNGSNQSLKVSKHAKTSNNNNQNSHNKSNSNISPASASPPYYQQNDSNKRKTYSHANSGKHNLARFFCFYKNRSLSYHSTNLSTYKIWSEFLFTEIFPRNWNKISNDPCRLWLGK